MSSSERAQALTVDVRERVVATPAWAWLSVIVVASILTRYLLGRRDPGPWIFVDELIYSEMSRSFADGFEFSIRGVPTTAYGFIYPILIAPSYALFDSLASAYGAVKITNAVVMSLTAVPAYLLARRLMRPAYALAAALLSIAIPAMTYTGVVMTENAFYPAFVFALLAMVVALQRPSPLNQALALVSVVVAFLIRAQGIALAAAYVFAIAIFILLESRASREGIRGGLRRLKVFWPTWTVGIGSVIVFLVVQLGRGQSPRELLGAYGAFAESDRYSLTEVSRWFLYHLAELDLWTGIVPLAALILLSGVALSRHAASEERAFVAVAVPSLVFLTLVVAAFASQSRENRIEERNLFYVGVLLLVALMWWVDRGLPRPTRLFAFALIVAAALPGVIPYGEFINVTAVSDTFGFLPLWGLQERLVAPNHIPAVVMVVAIVVATLALVLPRRAAWAAPLLILGYFALAHSPIENRTNKASVGALFEGVGAQVDWIDRAVGTDASVAALWTSMGAPHTIWLNEFFNRSLGAVYYVTAPLPGNLPETPAGVDPLTGELRDVTGAVVGADYVLVDPQTELVGDVIAVDPGRGSRLVEVGGPVLVAEQVAGIFADRWSGAEASYTRFACNGGELEVTISSDAGIHPALQTVTAFNGETELASTTVDPVAAPTTLVVPLVSTDGVCSARFAISPTAIPAEVAGLPDTRARGVRFETFNYTAP